MSFDAVGVSEKSPAAFLVLPLRAGAYMWEQMFVACDCPPMRGPAFGGGGLQSSRIRESHWSNVVVVVVCVASKQHAYNNTLSNVVAWCCAL